MLQQADIRNYRRADNVVYPNSPLGNSLKQVAQLTLSTVFAKPTFALKSDSAGGTDITLAPVVVGAAAGQPAAAPVGTGNTGASLLASPHDATWFIRSG